MQLDKKGRGHALRMIGLSLLSAILAIAMSFLDRSGLIPGGLRPVAALLPIIPLIAFFVGFSRWLKSLDELQRIIHLEALLVQFAATGILVMGWGMLVRFRVIPDLRVSQIYPVLWLAIFGFWVSGFLVIRRKYL